MSDLFDEDCDDIDGWNRVKIPIDETVRLRKSDRFLIVDKFQRLGCRVTGGSERIEAWDNADRYICGAYWSPGNRAWRFDSPRPHLFTLKDLSIAVDELHRDREANQAVVKAWERYKKSKSKKNWKLYMGTLAAFYLRQAQ